MLRLRKRAEFLAAMRGRRLDYPAFSIESAAATVSANAEAGNETARPAPRFGFTVTKKVGNAVVRNRVRRRLKEAVRAAVSSDPPQAGDFVIIGRRQALALPFQRLRADIGEALGRVLQAGRAGRPRRPGGKAPV